MPSRFASAFPRASAALLAALACAAAPADGIARRQVEWRRGHGEDWVLAVTVVPEPGWHVYWENPGDSGDSPAIEVSVPEALEAGPTVYPRPEVALVDGGPFYGYTGEVTYLVRVGRRVAEPGKPPRRCGTADGEPWKVSARVMACKERCTVTAFSAEGTWPPVAADAAAAPLSLEGGEVGGRSLPSPAPAAAVKASVEGGRVRIEGPSGGAEEVRFIPSNVPGMRLDLPEGQPAVQGGVRGGRFSIDFPLRSPGIGEGQPAVAGLVLLGNRRGDPCVRVRVPASAAPAASDPAQPSK